LRTRKKKAALAADSFFDLGPLEDRENNPPGVTREKEAVQYWTAFFRGRKSKINFAQLRTRKKKAALAADSFFDLNIKEGNLIPGPLLQTTINRKIITYYCS
jgi:hypothetical protein